MADKEVEVGGKTYGENSKVTLKVSTVLWIVGGLISLFTTLATIGYFDIKGEVDEQKSKFEQERLEYKEEIRKLLEEELKYERDKREKISEDLGEIKGDIKVILEKTRHLENGGSGGVRSDGPDSTFRPAPHNH
ncbi:MAG: hypothetical protein AABY15_07290 [Nanoarchaeota archaeon]